MSDAMQPKSPVVSIESFPQAVVVHVLCRELVAQHDLDSICAAVDKAQQGAPAIPFILDMAKVAFMGSLAMGVLVGLSQEFKSRGQRVVFADLQPNVLQTINVSRIHRIIEIAPDVDSALRVVKG